ncbi:MAG: glycosyltransferase family 4 protein [Raineya sp.]|nr:glycosyltransferase family 4 protein [Raineya sp.]
MQDFRSLYAAFDVFPSAKGASTHIQHFASTLLTHFPKGLLWVLGDEELAETETWQNDIYIQRIFLQEKSFWERVEKYSEQLGFALRNYQNLEIVHFRDIWSGVPLLSNPHKNYKTIFEVNALPSIELTYRYEVSSKIIHQIRHLEKFCLEASDKIVVPSTMIKDFLQKKGIKAEKISVITNGADIPSPQAKPAEAPEKYVIYFGALQSWQGVDTLLRAFRLLQDLDIFLVICASHKPRFCKIYHKFAEKLGLQEKIIWKYRLPKNELSAWVQHALCSIAPLKECSRNLEQGCSPLKILESMAAGTPVIASDMPVVREIIINEHLGKLIRADRPMELARAIRIWNAYPHKAQEIGKNAQQHIQEHFTWQSKKQELLKLYFSLTN